jgi:O-antigen/teichoic acid export membrane protein
MVVSSGLVLGSTVALVLVGSKALEPYLVVRTVAAVAGAGLSVYWLISRIGIRIDRAMLLPTLRATLPFALSAALAVIYGSVDIPLTALLLGEQAAGYYAPASTLVMTLYLIPASLYGVMLPVLSAAYSENRDRFVALGRRFTLFGVLLGLAMGMSLFMMARPLVLGLFGAEYAPSIPLLRLLSLVLAMHCVSFASAAFLTAADRQTWRLMAQAVAAAANIALNLFLIPRWGLVGVAWAFVFSEVLLVGGYLLAMWIADRRLREVVALTPFAGQS